jgi:hypothetical protein
MLQEQIQIDEPQNWRTITDTNKNDILNEARRKYAFYLCNHCKEPYFGKSLKGFDCKIF